jgi:hypothetical protein
MARDNRAEEDGIASEQKEDVAIASANDVEGIWVAAKPPSTPALPPVAALPYQDVAGPRPPHLRTHSSRPLIKTSNQVRVDRWSWVAKAATGWTGASLPVIMTMVGRVRRRSMR